MIQLFYLTISEKLHWLERLRVPMMKLKLLSFMLVLLQMTAWQTVSAQSYCPAPAFLPALSVDGALGTVICESEDVPLSVTVEGGFPLLGTGYAISTNRLFQFDLDDPYGTATQVGNTFTGFFFTGGDLIDGTYYVLDYFNNGLYTIDLTTGALSAQIGSTVPQGGERWSGLAWDPSTQMAYTLSKDGGNSTLYSLDYTNGAVTVIGNTGFSNGEWLAIDNDGNAFAANANTLYSIDLTSGAGTVVGPTVINSNSSAQDADFDPATGLLYNFAHRQFTNTRLFNIVNPQTGEYTDLQNQTVGQLVFTALAIPGDQPALYNYAWSTGETTEDIVVNAVGNYTVSVTDLCGTEVVETISVSQDVQNTSTSCNTGISTGLDENGMATIYPATVLEGENGCLEGYTVEIGDTGSNTADCSMVGQSYMVAVFDADGNQVCWGNGFTFLDEVAPIIECTDLTLSCTDDTNTETMADVGVVATDNCTTNPTLTHTEVANLGCTPTGGFGTITRTWTATDAYGNSSSCTQTITITRPSLDDLVCPGNYDGMTNPVFECNGNWTPDDEGHPAPSETGEPTLNNETLDNVCMFDRTYSDQVFDHCGDTYDILRTWTVIDWCNSGEIATCTQTIKIMDTVAPTLTCPANITESAGSNCNASVFLPDPTALSDACSPDGLDFTITHTAGTLVENGANNVLLGLELGTSTVAYTATDGCGNTSSCSFSITIIDDIVPVAICEINHVVNLGTNEPSLVFAETFDDGSYDYCGVAAFEVRRLATPTPCIDFDWTTAGPGVDETPNGSVNAFDRGMTNWYPAVPFACCDIGGNHVVEFRVTDVNGNSNTCSVAITVEDMLPPAIACPADKMISCEGYVAALATYDGVTPDADGQPDANATSPLAYFTDENNVTTFIGYFASAADNCDVTVTITDGFLEVDDCGNSENAAGVDAPFLRTYTATDSHGNTTVCTQEITIYNDNPFNPATDVTYPAAEVVVECTDISTVAGPTVNTTSGCESAGAGIADELILPSTSADFCFKLIRTWEVYNWCGASPTTPVATWEQIIKVTDSDAPVFEDCPSNATIDEGEDMVFSISATDCTDPYSPQISAVLFEYEIDQGNDNSIEVTGVGTLSTVTTGAGTILPVGENNVIFSATDACENVNTCSVIVTVTNTLDCDDFINPTVFELNVGNNPSGTTLSAGYQGLYNDPVDASGVNISLSNNDPNPQPTINFVCSDVSNTPVTVYFYLTTGEICSQDIRVVDINPPAQLSCGANISLQTNPVNDIITFDFSAANRSDWIEASDICSGSNLTYSLSENTLDCNAVGSVSGSYPVTISVTDENGNITTCDVQVPYNCGPTPPMNIVTGAIGNEENGMLSNVVISPASGMDVVTTDANGYFSMNLPTFENYDITPTKDDDYLNGVSTYDVVLMSKHILGIELLDSPYKMIAGDINKSGDLTTLDMVNLRKIILFIDLEFANNTSWRFVDAGYVFNDPTEPFNETFPETYPINQLEDDMQDIDFIAVKTGDVNGSAEVELNGEADDRNFEGELRLAIDEQMLKAGETYSVEVKAKDFKEMLGYQFTLGFEQNAIEVLNVVPGDLSGLEANNFNLNRTHEGVITTSWNQQAAVSLDDNTVLFTLEIQAKQAINLSAVLKANSRLTAAEAYRESGADVSLMNLALEYNREGLVDANDVFALYQNRPNPFKDETLVTFSLPEADEITLKVYDLSGKIMKEISGKYDKGYNELTISRSDLNASGVLYYELSTSKHTALQKMIVID